MVVAQRIIEGSVLGTSVATYFTSPTNVKTLIKKLTFTNTSANAVKVTVYLVPPSGSAQDSNCVRKERIIAVNETYECYEAENHLLEAGGSIQALADAANSVTIMASGVALT